MARKQDKREEEKRLRTFGLILGALLILFGWHWTHKGHSWAVILTPLGALCALLGAAQPLLLRGVERRWMSVARVFAKINTFVILTVVYYLLLAPAAALLRLFGGDPLGLKGPSRDSYWVPTSTGEDLEAYERQF